MNLQTQRENIEPNFEIFPILPQTSRYFITFTLFIFTEKKIERIYNISKVVFLLMRKVLTKYIVSQLIRI